MNELQRQAMGLDGMIMSPEIGELAGALAKAQGEMGTVSKSADNPFFRSRYATLADCTRVLQECLPKHGLSWTQIPVDGDGATILTILTHSSGQYIGGKMTMTPEKKTPQGFGSAYTYARRYGLCAITGLAPDEDDDGNAASGNVKKAKDTTKEDNAKQQFEDSIEFEKEKKSVSDEQITAAKDQLEACKTYGEFEVSWSKQTRAVRAILKEDKAWIHKMDIKFPNKDKVKSRSEAARSATH